MSADKPCRLFMPVGFVDGYGVLNNTALFEYRCTDIYHPGDERVVRWEGPDVGKALTLGSSGRFRHRLFLKRAGTCLGMPRSETVYQSISLGNADRANFLAATTGARKLAG